MADTELILKQLELLQNEVKALGTTVNELRAIGGSDPLARKISLLLSDNNLQLVDDTLTALNRTSDCANRSECLVKMREGLEKAVDLYSEGRTDEARGILLAMQNIICHTNSPCMNGACSEKARFIITETSTNIDLAARLIARETPKKKQTAEAQEIASALDPLSYPARIKILELLAQKECNFTELSQALDLRTGHLQHHLRPLREAGYIRRLNGRGRYSITPRGSKMLNGAMELVAAARM